MATNHVLASQLPVNTKSSEIPLQSGTPPPTIVYPFQIELASLGTADASDAISIASNSLLASVTTLYRHAKLTSLKATIHPTGQAPAYPTTVALAWVPYNSTATSAQILSVYGGQMFCIGGSINSLSPIDVPCNLTNVNPVIKDSVTYSDTPKLLLYSIAQTTAPTLATCSVTITGTLTLHSPLLQATA
uniref:Capsid protein n=1 Tax=Kennedya yellow mosaic virus TaxID=12158 RepID=O55437_9VIRU|nr:virion protein [Kennedya yellow mosaic virus]